MVMKQNPAEMIERLSRELADDFRIMPLDAPEAPLFLSVAMPRDEGLTGLKPRLPAGRGLTRQQATLAAAAEALELRASLAQQHVAALRLLPREAGITMVEATDLLSGATVPVPAQAVYLDCAAVLSEPLQQDADSTGCAVGPDRDKATETALWECVERDAVALWWHGNRRGAGVPLEMIDTHQPRLFWWLHQRARVTRLFDVTTDIGLPVIVAVASDGDGRVVAVGSAARPEAADAALAAVTEMVQTEVGLELARAARDPEALAWAREASVTGQPQFHQGPMRGPTDLATDALLGRLADLGHRALAVEMTLPGDPMPSMRVLVPGLCAMRGRTDTARFARLCPGQTRLCLPEPY